MTAASSRQLHLFTTIDASGDRGPDLARLVASVAAFRQARPSTVVRHHLLVQRCHDVETARARFALPDWVEPIVVDRQLPLSIARNLMLDPVLAEGSIDPDALVSFPDDDGWYPEGTLEHVHDRFARDPELDLWFCRYGSKARFVVVDEQRPGLQDVLSSASSNTIMLRGALLIAIGGFDERLGLGTPAKSGEDTEFAIRAYLVARRSAFAPAILVGHRDFSREVRAKYFGGSLAAISRHAGASAASAKALLRKLAVGVALVAKGEMKPADFTRALQLVASERSARRSPSIAPGRPSMIRSPLRRLAFTPGSETLRK
jgi:hypothetical protein